jgi:hypothetical protein
MPSLQRNNFIGLTGFNWWVGVVENRLDPLNLCRVQVRIFGWHTDNKELIPSEDLPWAHPVLPINNSDTFKTPHEGEYVIGFFYDGESGQFPSYFGVIPGIPITGPNQDKGFSDQRHDLGSYPAPFGGSAALYPNRLDEPTTSRLYRNEKINETIIQREKDAVAKNVPTASGGKWSQPEPSYAAKPPFNRVVETESGHVLEFDDTKDHERIHLAHRTGTYQEIRPDGTEVTKIVKDNYEVIAGSDFLYVKGACNVTVDGNATLQVGGNVTALVKGNVNATVNGNITTKVGGNYDITAGGHFTVKASTINLN